jgi:hypothetical protein
VKEGYAQVGFELPNLLADRPWRHEKLGGGKSKARVPCGTFERADSV